ncbi:MAG: hypothetical protein IPO08_23890 [Xanthomonadales bacterium]|nr:hypothetical protein [Xanthomonadales bacterium]
MTETLEIDGTTYALKTRLGWLEQRRIDEAGLRLMADGATISAMSNINDLPEVEIKIDAAEKDYKRLCARVMGVDDRAMKALDVLKITPAHVPHLLARIVELETEAAQEIAALADVNPLTLKA